MDDRESLVGRRGRSAWLAAPPLIILLAIVAAFVIIGLASEFITRLAGAQASDNFVADVITRFGMPMLFAPLAIFAYALVALARWRSARRRGQLLKGDAGRVEERRGVRTITVARLSSQLTKRKGRRDRCRRPSLATAGSRSPVPLQFHEASFAHTCLIKS
jgi:hypothetical protein